MNINCINKCFHQHNGKCTLSQVPSYSQSTQVTYSTNAEIGCPYYSSKTDYPNIIA